ncbi:hypothetical protein BX070DRAFT_221381 [Coemansia spiralis]|nr:hypothetical protein BX070DRAFT_221381 [Coemansia spiralis]
MGQDMLGGEQASDTAAQTARQPNPAGTDDLAMDMALLDTVAGDPLAYSTASSLLYGRSMPGTSAEFPAAFAGVDTHSQAPLHPTTTPASHQQQQSAGLSTSTSSQEIAVQMAARIRAARARILNNVLYNMSLGGIQQLDGFYNGSIAAPLSVSGNADSAGFGGGFDNMATVSQSSDMSNLLAGMATSNQLGFSAGRAANFTGLAPFDFSTPQPDLSAYSMTSSLSPFSPMSAVTVSGAGGIPGITSQDMSGPTSAFSTSTSAPNTATLPRIDQACKMCRRRKVRCDGLRPSCTFCHSKRFECVYEPVAPGTRKRGRKSKASDSGSVISSNAASTFMYADDGTTLHRLSSIRSGSGRSGEYDNRRGSQQRLSDSISDADDEHGYQRYGKQARSERRARDGYSVVYPSMADLEKIDVENGYLEALSNRQIALPDNVGPGFKLQDILDSRADIELAEEAAAAALASIAGDSRDSNAPKSNDPLLTTETKTANTAAGDTAVPISMAERHMQLYFAYFHPQHPILHRHTFEKAVREGTVNKVLWHAVQAIAARYGPSSLQLRRQTNTTDKVADEMPGAVVKDVQNSTEPNGSRDDTAMDVDDPSGNAAIFIPQSEEKMADNEKETNKLSKGKSEPAQRKQHPYEYGKPYAELVRAMLPEATRTLSIEFGMGDWLEGSSYWGTAVRMFNQLQLHMIDEAFQFPAYTSHLGLHESAISPLTSKQSPANYASEMRKPTLNNESWIKRELERRMRWVLFESERMHSLAGGHPPLVTLEAGWVHMPCSDAIWEMAAPRRAAEYERLLLHMGRYYVDTGGSLRIDIASDAASIPSSRVASISQSANESSVEETSDIEKQQNSKTAAASVDGSDVSGNSSSSRQQDPKRAASTTSAQPSNTTEGSLPGGRQHTRRKTHTGPMPNRVASMLVGVRRRKNRLHLNAHTAIVIGQMTRARLALFRLFFPCRWPSQLMASNLFGSAAGTGDEADLGGGGGAPGPVVLSWDERFRRMRITIADIESKLMQWRVYLESMFPLREHEEGSGRTDEENREIHRERVEYANYRFMLAALIIQNRSTVLQLQACLARRERKIKCANQKSDMGETARQTLANHVLPNQPSEKAMRSLRAYGQECWMVIVRQGCEIEDLLESHWQVRPHSNPNLHVMIKPDWHAPDAIKAKINAESNLRLYPEAAATRQRPVDDDVKVYFSHETPPYPLLVVNQRLLEAVVKSANKMQKQIGAELTLASSMNSNIHIETNANARDMGGDALLAIGGRQRGQQKSSRVLSGGTFAPVAPAASSSGARRRGRGVKRGPRIPLTSTGEVDFGSADDDIAPASVAATGEDGTECGEYSAMDPFRMQLSNTSYFLFLAAKTMIMYLHHAKMSAYILARRKVAGNSENGDIENESIDSAAAAAMSSAATAAAEGGHSSNDTENPKDLAGAREQFGAENMLMPDFTEDLSPPPQLKTLTDIRRMQDRLEVKYWMGLRNMSVYGPWRYEDPLVNEEWPPHVRLSEDFSNNVVFGT